MQYTRHEGCRDNVAFSVVVQPLADFRSPSEAATVAVKNMTTVSGVERDVSGQSGVVQVVDYIHVNRA